MSRLPPLWLFHYLQTSRPPFLRIPKCSEVLWRAYTPRKVDQSRLQSLQLTKPTFPKYVVSVFFYTRHAETQPRIADSYIYQLSHETAVTQQQLCLIARCDPFTNYINITCVGGGSIGEGSESSSVEIGEEGGLRPSKSDTSLSDSFVMLPAADCVTPSPPTAAASVPVSPAPKKNNLIETTYPGASYVLLLAPDFVTPAFFIAIFVSCYKRSRIVFIIIRY